MLLQECGDGTLEALRKLAADDRCVAIGQISDFGSEHQSRAFFLNGEIFAKRHPLSYAAQCSSFRVELLSKSLIPEEEHIIPGCRR